MVWGIALLLALLLGWLDYETTSWKVLLCNKGNLVALLIYTLQEHTLQGMPTAPSVGIATAILLYAGTILRFPSLIRKN